MKPASTSARAEQGPVHLTIHGLVQGVGYRDSFSLQAQRHGVDGWIRNRRDGTVEAIIHGPPHALQAVIEWARRGPPAARVEAVATRAATADETAGLTPGFHRRITA